MSSSPRSSPAALAPYADLPLYHRPELYDVAFGFRDVKAECDGLLKLARRYGARQPRSVVELACGPAHHLCELARRGLDATGIDINPGMLKYAQHLCEQAGVKARFQRGDVRTFTLPKPVDLALCLFDSFGLCTSDDDAIAALQATADGLRRGGLFILELSHPVDFFGPGRSRTRDRWTEHNARLRVKTRFSFTRLDAVAETFVARLTLDPIDRKTGKTGRRLAMRWLQRMWFRSAIQYVAARNGRFEIVGWHGDMDPRIALSSRPESWRMLVVLRRR